MTLWRVCWQIGNKRLRQFWDSLIKVSQLLFFYHEDSNHLLLLHFTNKPLSSFQISFATYQPTRLETKLVHPKNHQFLNHTLTSLLFFINCFYVEPLITPPRNMPYRVFIDMSIFPCFPKSYRWLKLHT